MSMRHPSVDSLLEKIDSKYKIAYISAKRARQIVNEGQSQLDFVEGLPTSKSVKPVGMALEEILYETVDYKLIEK